jgi:hypothetical protein
MRYSSILPTTTVLGKIGNKYFIYNSNRTEVFDMVKVKVKLSLHQAINTYGGVDVWLHGLNLGTTYRRMVSFLS